MNSLHREAKLLFRLAYDAHDSARSLVFAEQPCEPSEGRVRIAHGEPVFHTNRAIRLWHLDVVRVHVQRFAGNAALVEATMTVCGASALALNAGPALGHASARFLERSFR